MLREYSGIVDPPHDRTHDLHSGHAGDVGHHVMELDIHLHERLLHALDVRRRLVDQAFAMAEQRPKSHHALVRAEAAAEQPMLMQLLEPLRIVDVRLPPRDILDVAGIDEEHLEAACLQDLEHWDPVDPGRLHGDGGDANLLQPVGESVQIARETPKCLD